MYTKNLEIEAEILKALANPVRLCIVAGLMEEDGCKVGKIEECLGLAQSTVSQHIGKLRAAGIIKGERQGTQIHYRVVDERVKQIVKILMEER